MRHRFPPILAYVLLVAGCFEAGEPEYVVVGAVRDDLLPECPEDAIPVGRAGSTVWETVDVDWMGVNYDAISDRYVYLRLPDDLLSIALTVENGDDPTAVLQVVVDDATLLDLREDLARPPFLHVPTVAGSLAMPVNARTYPSGECMAIDVVGYGVEEGEIGTLHVVTRRDEGGPGVVDMNVVVVGDTEIDDDEIDAAMERVHEVWSPRGDFGLGRVGIHELEWPDEVLAPDDAGLGRLRAERIGDDPYRINVFVVQGFDDPLILGMAAATPGPNGVAGTRSSGVVVAVDSHLDWSGEELLTDMLGDTIAHEVGHQLGLFHPTESAGDRVDPIADTPECTPDMDSNGDGSLSAAECDGFGGRNFMFWTSSPVFEQTGVTGIQSAMLRDNVITRPL